jgi:hypothetical protein
MVYCTSRPPACTGVSSVPCDEVAHRTPEPAGRRLTDAPLRGGRTSTVGTGAGPAEAAGAEAAGSLAKAARSSRLDVSLAATVAAGSVSASRRGLWWLFLCALSAGATTAALPMAENGTSSSSSSSSSLPSSASSRPPAAPPRSEAGEALRLPLAERDRERDREREEREPDAERDPEPEPEREEPVRRTRAHALNDRQQRLIASVPERLLPLLRLRERDPLRLLPERELRANAG